MVNGSKWGTAILDNPHLFGEMAEYLSRLPHSTQLGRLDVLHQFPDMEGCKSSTNL